MTHPRLRAIGLSILVVGVLTASCSKNTPTTPSCTDTSLSSVVLTPASVTVGTAVQGTVTLACPAGSGGANVTLSSSSASATVPASVSIPSGSSSATFSVTTVAAGTPTISAASGGVTKTANLVVAVTLTARFTVVSLVNAAVNTCQLASNGNSLSCRFDGSTSTSPNGFKEYQWTWQLPTRSVPAITTSSTLDNPSTNGCGLFTDLSSTVKASGNPISMTVRLTVVDTAGNVSAEASNINVQILPIKGACGFNF